MQNHVDVILSTQNLAELHRVFTLLVNCPRNDRGSTFLWCVPLGQVLSEWGG